MAPSTSAPHQAQTGAASALSAPHPRQVIVHRQAQLQWWSLPAPMPEIIAHYGGLRVLVPTASPPGITRAWSRHRNVSLTSQVHLFSARPYRPGQGPITSAVDTNRWRPGFFSQSLSPAAPSDLGMPRLTLPEKRKVGGSTPPLTTTFSQR